MGAGREQHGPLYHCWLTRGMSFISPKESCSLGFSLALMPSAGALILPPTISQQVSPRPCSRCQLMRFTQTP